MNTTLMLIIELLGGLVLFLATGYTLSRVIGSNKYYDKMLYDDNDEDIITKNNNDGDIIHHVSI
jgi:hypothetical protein